MDDRQRTRPRFLQLVLSIVGGAFGVQSEATRQRDFQQNSPVPYIIGGLLFTVIFVVTIMLIVRTVLRSAGL